MITMTSKNGVHTVKLDGKVMDSFSTLWEAIEYAYVLNCRRAKASA